MTNQPLANNNPLHVAIDVALWPTSFTSLDDEQPTSAARLKSEPPNPGRAVGSPVQFGSLHVSPLSDPALTDALFVLAGDSEADAATPADVEQQEATSAEQSEPPTAGPTATAQHAGQRTTHSGHSPSDQAASDPSAQTDPAQTDPAQADAVQTDAVQTPPGQHQVPVWEVDRFHWPSGSSDLYERETEYFRHAGKKLREASQQGLHVLAMTSARSGEGCTTLAICLARAAAAAGARVAILDADLQQPLLGHALSLSFTHGWQQTLDENLPWIEAAVCAVEDRISVIPAGTDEAVPSAPGLPDLIETVAAEFDLLVVDLGQLTAAAEQLVHGTEKSPVNAVMIVRDVRKTSRESTMSVAERLHDCGVQAVGIAENFTAALPNRAAA